MEDTITKFTPEPVFVSNENFLQAVFNTDAKRAHVTGFKEDPTTLDQKGLRSCWAGGEAQSELPYHTTFNTFFTISVFHPDPISGRSRRRKVQFDQCYCIVLDDVGLRGLQGTSAKVEADRVKLKPSWALETSPGNWQIGYIVRGTDGIHGDTRGGKVNALLDALVANGLVTDGKDPGMKGVTRYVRLPVGKNTKAKYGTAGHNHVMGSWKPDRCYSLEDIADAYDVRAEFDMAADDLNAPVAGNFDADNDWLADVLIRTGHVHSYDEQKKLWHVTCPFIEEHTGRSDTGTAYLGTGRWTCHHGHCIDRDHQEFTDKVRADNPDLWKEKVREDFEPVEGEGTKAPSSVRAEMADIFGEEQVQRAEDQKKLGPFQSKMAGSQVQYDDLKNWNPLVSVPCILKGLVPEVGMGVVYGASGIGKSFVMMDWMLKVAAGQDWNGHRNKARDGVWVYISSEGGSVELKKRLFGWQKEYGDIPKNVHFYATSFGWGTDKTEAENFVRWCKLLGSPVRGVVIDTLNRNMAGDENSTVDMTGFVDCSETVWRGLGCMVAVVHHEGKDADRGARGSSVLKGAAEFEWRVFRDDDRRRGGVAIDKNRHGEDGMVYGFELGLVSFGKDADGDEVGTLVVRAGMAPTGRGAKVRKGARTLMQAYDVLAQGNGWVKTEEMIAEAADLHEAETGKRLNPRTFRRDVKEQLVEQHGWTVMDDAILSPNWEPDDTKS